ncbi:hypothetical protein SUGI_0338520 [Cryptomeria japonica]|nr:hypothetical protein SUGI_0338520 [Cryptomeria japonica]
MQFTVAGSIGNELAVSALLGMNHDKEPNGGEYDYLCFSHVLVHPQRYEYGDMGKLSTQTEGTKLGLPVEVERNDGGSDVLQECVVGFLEMQNPHEAHGFLETPAWVKKGLEREIGGQIALHGMERTGQSHHEQQHSNLQKLWEAFGLGGSPQEGIKQQSESERRNRGTDVLDPNPLEYELYDSVCGRVTW